MYNEDMYWFNSNLLSYYDDKYETKSHMRIAVSTSTIDKMNFSEPKISIGITNINKLSKVVNLSIYECTSLLGTLKQVVKNQESSFNSEDSITRKISNKSLILKFSKLDSEYIIRITIFVNESDNCEIIIPFEVFTSILHILKSFVEDYINTTLNINRNSLLSLLEQESKVISKSIYTLPTLVTDLSNSVSVNDSNNIISSTETEKDLSELNAFIGDNFSNVEIPELEKIENVIVDPDKDESISKFTKTLIENDIGILEEKLITFATSKSINMSFQNWVQGEFETSILPGINENSYKSIQYITKVIYGICFRNYLDYQKPIPQKFYPIKYKCDSENILDSNKDLAYDLLLYLSYIRLCRERLGAVIPDSIDNKSLLYLQLRCAADPLIFSFFNKNDNENIQNIISNRFLSYDKNKIFDSFKKVLTEFSCKQITDLDIRNMVQKIFEDVVKDEEYVDKLHTDYFHEGLLTVPYENDFTLEQIINEISVLDIEKKFSVDIVKNLLIDKEKISDVTRNYFQKARDTKMRKDNNTQQENLIRFAKSYRQEIPDDIEEDFWNFVKTFEGKLTFSSFPNIDKLGENLVKALYNWDPENSHIINNYKYFVETIEKEIMSKDLIISRLKTHEEGGETTVENDWSFIVD
jgi:hypothetical protein